ncbi:putative methylenetetrahydrofolate reductase (NADH) [Carex rostrata]
MHIINKIKESTKSDDSHVIFSFEYFTPKFPKSATAEARAEIADAFIAKVARMAAHGASFCDITWRPTSADVTVDLAGRMQTEIGVDTMMHLTCLGMTLDGINRAIDGAKSRGVSNILALGGDPPVGAPAAAAVEPAGVNGKGVPVCALDLVEHIRLRHGDYFGLGVAGYPEAHPSKILEGSDVATKVGYEEDLVYLKKKVDAGSHFIVTQLFYDMSFFFKFVDDCRRIGIQCPIVPGILPIVSYRSFQTMTKTCRTKVPTEIRETVERLKSDEVALAAYGIQLATEMCAEILRRGIRELHFYTMNREEPTLAVLRRLGLVKGGENETVPRVLAVKEEGEEKKSVANGAKNLIPA